MSNNDRYRRFNLRIPKETFDLLQEEADANSHSMNAEIVQRLERSIGLRRGEPPTESETSALEGVIKGLLRRTTTELPLSEMSPEDMHLVVALITRLWTK